MYYHHAETIVV